ncbi:MAG: orotidine 5'-phosphate decarboxylase [Lentisphaerae bacterium GWF2_52_8]|nr:MAG: orotidine 5'-phosphate decarboxylase [Lentisphaerae bacterium GWF2_52_8]
MSFMNKLRDAWKANNSFVCVGLDPDPGKLPKCLADKKYPIFEFNKAIIDASADLVCCYKPQFAYYGGSAAEEQLEMSIAHIAEKYPQIPVILDSKRGDIGSTAEFYAREAFSRYRADAVTVNPFMGTDTLEPFLKHANKGVVILCRTSNPSASEIQSLKVDGKEIYKIIAKYADTEWNYNKNVMLVVGATCPDELAEVRAICPDIPFLVPGVGAQGGDIMQVVLNGRCSNGLGLVINSSRGIIYASKGSDFAEAARRATMELRDSINNYR